MHYYGHYFAQIKASFGMLVIMEKKAKGCNISNIQDCYLMGDFNIDLLSRNEILLDRKHYGSYCQAPPLVKKYMDLCFSHFLHQLTPEPTRTTKRTETLTDHILTNSPEKMIKSGTIEMRLFVFELLYCTRKMSLLKLNKHYKISIRSMTLLR